jgi:hypothetical protein
MAENEEEFISKLGRQECEWEDQPLANHRYVIEAKDAFGWFDYSRHSDLNEAKKQVAALREGFGSDLILVDLVTMTTINVCTA